MMTAGVRTPFAELTDVHQLSMMVADVFALVHLPNDYDLVLRFSPDTHCAAFRRALERLLAGNVRRPVL